MLKKREYFFIVKKEIKMSKFGMKFPLIGIMAILLLYGVSYSMGHYPAVERENRADLTGTFTVIFYGGTYSNDPAAIAILDVEGDDYDFEPYTSEYNYQIKNGVPAGLALKESRSFVSQRSDFFTSQLKRITGENGTIIGYELRPLYHSMRFGRHDILDVRYWLSEKTVFVTVDIKRDTRNRLLDKRSGKD
jgi:hypothetical protein